MAEPDIKQHIISAGRGNFSDLTSALQDINERITGATVAQIRSSAPELAMIPVNWTAALQPVNLTDEATIAIDLDAGRNFHLAIGGNRTMGNAANRKPGQAGIIWIEQPAGGGHTLAWSATWAFVGTPIIAVGASAISAVFYTVITVDRALACMVKA